MMHTTFQMKRSDCFSIPLEAVHLCQSVNQWRASQENSESRRLPCPYEHPQNWTSPKELARSVCWPGVLPVGVKCVTFHIPYPRNFASAHCARGQLQACSNPKCLKNTQRENTPDKLKQEKQQGFCSPHSIKIAYHCENKQHIWV